MAINDFDIMDIQPNVVSRDLKGKYIWLYGKGKVGKTSFAAQIDGAFICAFEIGTNMLNGVYYKPIDKWATFKKIIKQLERQEVQDKFKTIVIDTASVAYGLCEKFILQREGVDTIKDIPFGAGYGMVQREFDEALRKITMLGYGLIIITHEKKHTVGFANANNEEDEQYTVEPDLPKRAADVCNEICDIVGYIGIEFEDGVAQRYIYTRETQQVYAGARLKYIEPKIKFGYQELVAAINDALDKEQELDGITVVDHKETEKPTVVRKFDEVLAEAKNIWMSKLDGAKDEEEKEQVYIRLNDIVMRLFGKQVKLSTVPPSQQDLLELFIEEAQDI